MPVPSPRRPAPPSGSKTQLARKRRNRQRGLSLGVGFLGLTIFVLLLRYLDWMWQGGPQTMVENTGAIIFAGIFGLGALVAAAIIWPRR